LGGKIENKSQKVGTWVTFCGEGLEDNGLNTLRIEVVLKC